MINICAPFRSTSKQVGVSNISNGQSRRKPQFFKYSKHSRCISNTKNLWEPGTLGGDSRHLAVYYNYQRRQKQAEESQNRRGIHSAYQLSMYIYIYIYICMCVRVYVCIPCGNLTQLWRSTISNIGTVNHLYMVRFP